MCLPACLQARCQMAGDVLLGYYEIPEHLDEPLNTVVNPIGLQVGGIAALPSCWALHNAHLWMALYPVHSLCSSCIGRHDQLPGKCMRCAPCTAGFTCGL